MAPVQGMPPKNGQRMLPTPSASNSESGSCLVPAIASATTAERSDSMAPRSAMAMAAGNSARKVASVNGRAPPLCQGRTGSGGGGRAAGDPAPTEEGEETGAQGRPPQR